MGIFSRIGDVLKANINDMIDRAEARQHRHWARQWQASALQSGSMRMP